MNEEITITPKDVVGFALFAGLLCCYGVMASRGIRAIRNKLEHRRIRKELNKK